MTIRSCGKCGGPLHPEYGCCEPCIEAHRAQEARDEACRELKRWWSTGSGGGEATPLMPTWPWARFDNSTWRERCADRILAAVQQWHPGRGSLLILGPTGAGKSSALVALAHSWLAVAESEAAAGRPHAQPRFLYLSGLHVAEATKARRLGDDEHPLLRRAMRAQVLLWDELSTHTPAHPAMALADARYSAGLPTLAASGLTKAQFGAHFGAALLRRLIEGAGLLDCHRGSR